MSNDGPLKIGEREFTSRLIMGIGKYADLSVMQEALAASGTQFVTYPVRRMKIEGQPEKTLLDYIDRDRYTIMPNTAGCYTAEEAIRALHLAREDGLDDGMVKLEVLSDERTLLPEPIETLKATETLVKEGFTVLVYTSDDPIIARRLQDLGATSVMPAGSPIGSGQGVLNRNNIRIIMETATVPIILDAGVGTASDVAVAMELGVDAVLVNTGVAHAKDPVAMAAGMRYGTEAGRMAYLAGRIPRKLYAKAGSAEE